MKVEVSEKGNIELKEVYSPLKLISKSGEELFICMRDSGFEIVYGGERYDLKENKLSFNSPELIENDIPCTNG